MYSECSHDTQKQPLADILQKTILKNFAISQKTPVSEYLFNKRPKGLQETPRCFPVSKLRKSYRSFFIEHLWWQLLDTRKIPGN